MPSAERRSSRLSTQRRRVLARGPEMTRLRHKRRPSARDRIVSSSSKLLRSRRPCRQARRAKAVEHAVVGPDVDAAVGDRETAEVIPRRDLILARPQLLAGLTIEGI